MSGQIRTMGFRNALLVGEFTQSHSNKGSVPKGLGILLDDMYLTCISSWAMVQSQSVVQPSGPTVVIYPHRQVLYIEKYPQSRQSEQVGFWCFTSGEYRIFGKGLKQQQNVAILHLSGNVVAKVSVRSEGITIQMENSVANQQEQWSKIQEIIGGRVSQQNKSFNKFIHKNFTEKLNQRYRSQIFVEEFQKNHKWFGLFNNGEGLAISQSSNNNQQKVQSIGFYRSFQNKNMAFGKKCIDEINSNSYRINQGIFENGQVYEFQFDEKRPTDSYKTSSKFFKQTTSFCNKFVRLTEVDEIYKKLHQISRQHKLKVGTKYGQKIIEAGRNASNNNGSSNMSEISLDSAKRANIWQSSQDRANRIYNLNEARAAIENEISKKKGSHTKIGTFHFNNRSETEDRSPLTLRMHNYDQISSRKDRSPFKNSNKKYEYFDKQTQNNFRIAPFTNSPHLKSVEQLYSAPQVHVNQFSLGPQTDRFDYILKEKREKLREERYAQQNLYEIEYQIQKQRQLKLLKSIQNDQLLHKQPTAKVPLTKLHTFGYNQFENMTTRQNYNYKADPHLHLQQTSDVQSQNHFKRKYTQNYKYFQQVQKQKQSPKKQQFAHRIDDSPIMNLYSALPARQISKSPLGRTARRGYTYVD